MSRSDIGNEKTWSRHYDEKFNAWYYYNEKTKESVWEGENGAAEIELFLLNEEDIHQNTEATKPKKAKNKKLLSGFTRYLRNAKNQEIISTDVDTLLDKPVNENSPTWDEVKFVRLALCAAIFLESWLCFLEGLIRCVILVFIAISATVCFNKDNYFLKTEKSLSRKLKQIFSDILLTSLSSVLLIIPGYIYFIYRKHSAHESWALAPIPSFIGSIDPRRFATITILGFGRIAENSVFRQKSPKGKVDEDLSLDAWKDSIVYFPKDVLLDCNSLLHGSERASDNLSEIFV